MHLQGGGSTESQCLTPTSTFVLLKALLFSPQGVAVDVLGVFYILQKHSSMVVPRFHLSERVAQAQGLSYASSDIPGMPGAQSL